MSDDRDRVMQAADRGEERALGAALRALPLISPTASALPRLQAQWAVQAGRPAPKRHRHWWAIAASVVAIGLAVIAFRKPAVEVVTQPMASTPSNIESLMAQSAEWERALHRFEQQSIPMTAGSAMAGAELEDLIGLTDLQLSAAADDTQAEPLWQRRVNLMSRLAEVRTQSAWQRGNTEQNPMLLAAAYPIN